MVVVIYLSFFFFWYFGKDKGGVNGTVSSVIAATDPNKAMLVALFISMMITGVNMSSNIAHADHTKYLKYASPYNFIAAGVAAVLFLIAGFIYK